MITSPPISSPVLFCVVEPFISFLLSNKTEEAHHANETWLWLQLWLLYLQLGEDKLGPSQL